ncbi:lantibiotic dehydratase, partial [Streptomyces sp. NPDC059104]|uniref:lantibiotic dehydratase n=1 Tax=Streptomyces sp. NPDC059104 TaxID=3346729 RepID=UPI0036997B70
MISTDQSARRPAAADHRVALAPGWSLWRKAVLRGAGLPFGWLDELRPQGHGTGHFIRQNDFLTALTWQNPTVLRNWLARHAAEGDGAAPRSAKREALLAHYAQRYCAKNDTIGFFGPVSWAEFDPSAADVTATGTGAVARGSVFFETWAVDALAAAWARDPDVFGHLPVRLHPTVSVSERGVHRPHRAPQHLSALQTALVEALRRAAAEPVDVRRLTAAVAAVHPAEPAAVHDELRALDASGIVTVGVPVPLNEHPETALLDWASGIGHPGLRERLLDELGSLTGLRDEVARRTDPASLLGALTALDERFAALTGASSRRAGTSAPAGRTLVYLDCRRDLDVSIGSELLDALRGPLGLLLDSARWFVAETAREVSAELIRRYRSLARSSAGEVTLDNLLFASGDVLSGAPSSVVWEIAEDFRARWAEVLGAATPDPDTGSLRLDCATAEPLVRALFPAGPLRWTQARYHSPDLMLCQRPDGKRFWVLGELHMALNTMESRVFHTQSDDPQALVAATAADLTDGRVLPLYPNGSPEVSPRTYPPASVHVPGQYVYWSYAADSGDPDGSAGLPSTALIVEERDGELLAGPRDGGPRAPVLEYFGDFLTALVVNRFQIGADGPGTPRVQLGEVVVRRASWSFPVADLPGRGRGGPAAEAALRDELIAAGVPRSVFVKLPTEPKPFYVDLDARLLVRNLRRAVARVPQDRAAEVHLSVVEMLPGRDDLWLVDAAGERYTSEFRVVAVDD